MLKSKVLNIVNKCGNIDKKALMLRLQKDEKEELDNALRQLINEGNIIEMKDESLTSLNKNGYIKGKFIDNKSHGHVKQKDGVNVLINKNDFNGAMDKDKVLCKIVDDKKGITGKIIKVLERNLINASGVYILERKVRLDKDDIIIEIDNIDKFKHIVLGQKVILDIVVSDDEILHGNIKKIIGNANDRGIDTLALLESNDVPIKFKDDVYKELKAISLNISLKEKERRKDLTELTTITIDNEYAKDLDDAVSLCILDNGNYSLGVHIADVSHYVKRGTSLDKEAYKRGTSIYLVDRVVPMLPEKISNEICSLNPNIEKLTLSCIMEIDKLGKVIKHEICESVIKTTARMTYNKVNYLLTENEVKLTGNDEFHIYMMLEKMNILRDILRKKRISRGSIEFESFENKIILDENEKVIDIVQNEKGIADNLIEEFMLVCNETIAEEYSLLGLPFIFRNEDNPKTEKIEKITLLLNKLGIKIRGRLNTSKSIQNTLKDIEKEGSKSKIANKILLRIMKLASYEKNNKGHFGLATKYYCHFTSPIRRYPDLEIHRIIKEKLNNKLDESMYESLNESCNHFNETERRADELERKVDKMKKAEYMSDYIGEEFEGEVSRLASCGIYVELKNTVEGMIRIFDLKDDKYTFNEGCMVIKGNKRKKEFNIGDKVRVKLIKVNKLEGEIYLSLI